MESGPEETNEAPESVPFIGSYDIATEHFKSMIDSYVSGLTITQEEIDETETTENNSGTKQKQSLV